MDTPGIEVRPLTTMTERAEFNEVFFTDVRVPEDQIVMGRGQGWRVANVTLKYERLHARRRQQADEPRSHRIRAHDGRRPRSTACALIDMPEYRDRLLRLQGEVMASKYHQLRLLTESRARARIPASGG